MKRKLSILFLLVIGLVVWTQSAVAQTAVPTVIPEDTPVPTAEPPVQPPPSDRDGDTLIDEVDGCPDEFGLVENNGCPIRDDDGDGTPNDPDECPSVAGPAENNGCLPVIPSGGRCYIATVDNERVNIRSNHLSTAEVVGSLSPAQVYPVLEQYLTDEGVWYRVTEGWVAGWVVRKDGNCPPAQASTSYPSGISSRPRSASVTCDGTDLVFTWQGLTFGGVYLVAYHTGMSNGISYFNRAASGIYTISSSESALWHIYMDENYADDTLLRGDIQCPEGTPLQRNGTDIFCGSTFCAAIWFLPGMFPLWWRRRMKKRQLQKTA